MGKIQVGLWVKIVEMLKLCKKPSHIVDTELSVSQSEVGKILPPQSYSELLKRDVIL